jgi:CDP-glucose 4,6-dehydratase
MNAPQDRSASKWPSLTGSNVFITGGTGLLGSHLTRLLVSQGANVVALVRDSVPRSLFYDASPEWDLQNKVTVVRGEIEDYPLIERIINEYEIESVFHLAAQTIVGTANRNPMATFHANVGGTWNVLEACRVHQKKIKRVLIASSDKAYGNLKGEAYNESFPLQGEHPYDVSKSCADLIARSYFVTYGLPVGVTRCGNFFGPGDLNFSRIIPGTVRDVLQGRAPVIRSDGTFIRDYIFAEDGARAYLTLAEAMVDGKFSGEAFNFSYGLRLTVKEVVDSVLKVMGKSNLKPEIRNEASHEIPVQCLDSTKAKNLLKWKPHFGFEEGLKQTVQWYVERLSG